MPKNHCRASALPFRVAASPLQYDELRQNECKMPPFSGNSQPRNQRPITSRVCGHSCQRLPETNRRVTDKTAVLLRLPSAIAAAPEQDMAEKSRGNCPIFVSGICHFFGIRLFPLQMLAVAAMFFHRSRRRPAVGPLYILRYFSLILGA